MDEPDRSRVGSEPTKEPISFNAAAKLLVALNECTTEVQKAKGAKTLIESDKAIRSAERRLGMIARKLLPAVLDELRKLRTIIGDAA
jgi:hypothetical protein